VELERDTFTKAFCLFCNFHREKLITRIGKHILENIAWGPRSTISGLYETRENQTFEQKYFAKPFVWYNE